jgi:hypothetical protein
MSIKRAFFTILVGGLVLTPFTVSRAQVDARRIDEVFKKDVLTPEDFQVIDAFMTDAVARLVRTIDFTEVAKRRAVILTKQRPQAQYAQRFSEAAGKEIAAGFDYAGTEITDPARRFIVFTNLLILVNELNDPRLADLAIRMIPQENPAVRYWAVQASTNPGVWQKLGQDQASAGQIARKIIDACNPVVATSSPETLLLMAQFAGRNSTPPADDLLGRVAEARIKSYATADVKYELVDTAILKLLSDKITAGSTPNPQLARQFAQLYSFAMQRYIKGVRANALREASRNYLASVLVTTEEQCLSKLLGAPQATIRRAVEASDMDGLQAEHDRLLGGANQAGALPSKFNFTYGSTGNSRVPQALPEPKPAAPVPAATPAPAPVPAPAAPPVPAPATPPNPK